MTGKNPTGQWYGKVINAGVPLDSITYGTVVGEAPGKLAHTVDEANVNYVNPSGKFKAQLVLDRSNVIRGIIFVQQ